MDRLLAQTLSACGAATLIEGVPGIGKTALLRYARDTARGLNLRVLIARGSELDQHLAFGNLRELFFAPLRSHPELAARVSAAVRPALGIDAADHPTLDPSAVSHGVRALLADLAYDRPTVLIVDDL